MSQKALTLVLEESQLQELFRIILDQDEEAALLFLRAHLQDKVRQALEGG